MRWKMNRWIWLFFLPYVVACDTQTKICDIEAHNIIDGPQYLGFLTPMGDAGWLQDFADLLNMAHYNRYGDGTSGYDCQSEYVEGSTFSMTNCGVGGWRSVPELKIVPSLRSVAEDK